MGIWVRDCVRTPGAAGAPVMYDVIFLNPPQRPFAASGRLRDILVHGLDREIPDDELQSVLKDVGLEATVARQGGLAAGELQALTFARLLLASPQFAFLDDPAKTLEAPLAERLYQALARSSITYVSAGCPPPLLAYHDLQLELHPDGSWQVEPAGSSGSADQSSHSQPESRKE